MNYKIITNLVRCKKCNTLIESVHRHDFNTCSCGSVSVDGGKDYLRRVFTESDVFEELSVTIEEPQ